MDADHVLQERPTLHGTEVECSCGDWDAWYNGERSRRFTLREHERHVRDAGPLRVQSTRISDGEVDQP